MAQLVIAAAGAAIGGAIGGPLGASIGWSLGSVVGAQFGPKQRSFGPRLEDLKVTGAEYGQAIPWVAGHPRVAGQVWWASDRREISTTTSTGKGGGGAEVTTYTYEVDLLIGLTDTVIAGVSRVWLNGRMVYVTLEDATAESVNASADNDNWTRLTVYTGDAAQLPDPTYEAAVGVGNAPAYRGRGSVFIEGLQLGNSGVIPNLTFEIATASAPPDPDILLNASFSNSYGILDTSCDSLGSASLSTIGPAPATYVDDTSITFWLDTTANGSADKGFGWVSASRFDPIGKDTTYEVLLSVGASTKLSGNSEPFFPVWAFGKNISLSGYEVNLVVDPWNSRCKVFRAFVGDSGWVSGTPRGAKIHLAVCVPSVVSAGNPIRYYINGTQVWTNNLAGFGAGIDSMYCGGNSGMVPPDTIHQVTYYGCRVTSGIKYPSGTAFTPPAEFTAPICVDSTAIDNVTLRQTVEALCARAGLAAGNYDASGLDTITKPVRAMAVGQVTPARVLLEQLMAGYYFEAYNTDKLYFVPRAGSSLLTIPADDMGCAFDVGDVEVLPMQVGSDEEVPAQMAVSYANVDADYNTATEFSDRLVSGQVSTSPAQLPLAFTAAEAKGIADAMLVDGYAGRVGGRLALPVAYARLVPTDVVTAPASDGTLYRLRLVRRTDTTPLLEYEWVLDDASAVVSAGITSSDYAPTISVALPGDTVMQLLDCPLLQDTEDQLGHYVAATSRGTTWPGGSINRSLDNVDYAEVARVSERAVIGTATTALPNFTGGRVFDETNTVTVSVATTLSSSTRAAMLDDVSVNAMIIGSEVIRFRTATLVTPGVYTLSGLLRGEKGTEWATGTHVANEAVVLLRTNGLRYIPIDSASLGIVRYYKGVTLGRTLASVTGTSFTCNGVSSKPLAPVNIRRTVGTANQITLFWSRRTRLSTSFTGPAGAVVPLGEATESYEVDVVLIAGSVLKRTLTATSPSVIYTAAMQTADGIGASTPIRFDVYQISASVGRGYAGSLTTAGAVTAQPQITTLTVGGTFATGAALYATLAGVTYNYTSVGGDTNLNGIASSFAAVIDAAAAYTATAVGAAINVTGATSVAFPVVAGVGAGDNTATWALTQTASATVAGVSNKFNVTFLNLSDPGGANAYPSGTVFNLLVQRIDPPLNLFYSYNSASAGRTDYTLLPIVASQLATAVAASGDDDAYGFLALVDPLELWTLNLYTPAAEPYNWTVQAVSSNGAISGLVGNSANGVTPATLRPQVCTLTLAGTPATGRTYRATLGGVNFDYVAAGGDTTMALVATGLAGVIDADANYLASAVGAVITITHASNNVPFTYAANIIASTVTLTAATAQEAA